MADIQDPKREAFQRKCSIIISLIASMLLVNNLGSQNAAGAASFQNAAAINTYAFYQAKNIRQNDLNLAAQTLEGIANTAVPLANESAKQKKYAMSPCKKDRILISPACCYSSPSF